MPPKATSRGAVFVGLLILATAALGGLTRPRTDLVPFLLGYGLSFALFLVAWWRGREALSAWAPGRLVLYLVLTGACLRVAAAIAPTSLSDDVYRYVWDGRLVLDGVNPYLALPYELFREGVWSDPLFFRLNSPEYHSVYPPVAQGFFAVVVGLAKLLGLPADRVMRLALGVVDLATIALLVALLRRLSRPLHLAALYAWNPFVAWEIAGGGHSEALMLPLLCLAILLALRRRPIALGLVLGVAALAKLTTLVFTPVLGWYLVRRRGWGAGLLAGVLAVIVLVAGYLPFWYDGLWNDTRETLSLYYGVFIFNTPLYDLARGLAGYREGLTPDVNDVVVPVFWAINVAAILGAALLVGGRTRPLAAGLFAVSMAQLLFSSVFHPWYLLVGLALSVVAGACSAVVLSGLVMVSYLAYHRTVLEVTLAMTLVQYVPFAAALGLDASRGLLGPVLRRRADRKYAAFAAELAPGSRILDIGAGEGFVGAVAAREGHDVQLVDVECRNQTPLPHTTYDGRHLPFESDEFDVGILSYVLHHCREPDLVLSEARRVCRRLVVLESVYDSRWERRLLTFLDHLANRLRGIPIEPLAFDRVDGWNRRFHELGLVVRQHRMLGRLVHKRALFVLERARPGERNRKPA